MNTVQIFPDCSGISGDGLARTYGAGRWLYPSVDIWEWVRNE